MSQPVLGKSIRKQFPFYKQNPQTAFLDSAASSLTPQSVIDAINDYYQNYSVNIHRGMYQQSLQASQIYDNTRLLVNQFLQGEHGETIFTHGTTEGFNLLSYSLEFVGKQLADLGFVAWKNPPNKNDVILISESEHHANIVPWQLLQKRCGIQIVYIPINKKNGSLDLHAFEQMKNELVNVKIVSLSAVSNVTGVVHDLTPFKDFARQQGALFVVDGAQSVSHIPTNLKQLDADFFVFSAHKMLAATGLGVLWGKKEILNILPPFLGGGAMIDVVTKESTTFNKSPFRFEAGTPHIAGVFSLQAAIHYLQKIGLENIQKHEEQLLFSLLKRAKDFSLQHFGPSLEELEKQNISKVGVFAFAMPNIHHHDMATLLAEQDVSIRVGHHCCQLLMQAFGVSGTARASLYLYNDDDDIDKLFNGLEMVQSIFQ